LLEFWAQPSNKNLDIKAFGIGSREMERLGFEILGRAEDLAVVGLVEVIKKYNHIKAVFDQIIESVQRRKPKVILLMDYPDFNLRLAKKLKQFGIPIVYYISPQVWAWRKSRIHEIKKYVDKMLVVLPFEKDFYKSNGVDVEFVGHPILDEINESFYNEQKLSQERSRYGIKKSDIWLGLMPGSRSSEMQHHLKTQIEAAELLYVSKPNLKFALLVAPTFTLEQIKNLLPEYTIPLSIIRDEPLKMISMMDLILCASGTATLIVGLLKKPMVIMYKMNFITSFLVRRIVKGTDHFGLINLILNRRVVPELFQENATPQNLSNEILKYINEPEYLTSVKNQLSSAVGLLGENGATFRVAKILNRYFV
ncbi:MAG: lipid-A-disaccharide synthase, partial [Bdellovibrionales bacterium]